MTTSRTIRVISRLLNEQYKPAPTPPKRARKPLKSFREVTGKTPVIISPRKADSENDTEIKHPGASQRKLRKEAAINELSQKRLRSYVRKASDQMKRDIDDDHIVDTVAKNLSKRFKKRQAGIFQATNSLVAMKNESAPTNSMGMSSSTHGTGAIDVFDPLLGGRKRKDKSKSKPFH